MSSISNNRHLKTYLPILILILCLVGFILEWLRIFNYDNPLSGFLMVSTFFTIHSNVFVFFSTLLFLFKKRSKHIDRFTYITTVDITITCIVFFTLLLPFMPHITFVQILLHGIIPPLFIFYYFVSFKTTIIRKSVWISMLHPLIYFIFVFTIVHPIYGEYLSRIYPDEIGPYVYPFLNYAYFNHGIFGMLLANFLVLFPLAFALSYLLLMLKLKFDRHILSV